METLMSIKSNLTRAIGLGVVVTALSAGAALAAVATSSANVHSGPGIRFQTIDRIHAGDYVRVTDRSRGWCEVSGDADGWVSCGIISSGRLNAYPVPPPLRYNPYRYNRFYDRGPSFSFGVSPRGPSFGFSTGTMW
jgi:hypothetical protein